MKKIITVLTIALVVLTTMNAQIKKPKINTGTTVDLSQLDGNLNLETIKGHIKSGKLCYTINAGVTAIIPPDHPKPVKGIDAYYSSTQYVKIERSYLRTNGKLFRSDKGFNRNQGNYFEILINPKRNDPKKVDVNQVKLTWRIPESQLRTFLLKNVSVQYKRHGILITGDYEVDGIVLGASIALVPTACLK